MIQDVYERDRKFSFGVVDREIVVASQRNSRQAFGHSSTVSVPSCFGFVPSSVDQVDLVM
jgi:hypothetical protein